MLKVPAVLERVLLTFLHLSQLFIYKVRARGADSPRLRLCCDTVAGNWETQNGVYQWEVQPLTAGFRVFSLVTRLAPVSSCSKPAFRRGDDTVHSGSSEPPSACSPEGGRCKGIRKVHHHWALTVGCQLSAEKEWLVQEPSPYLPLGMFLSALD